MSRVLFVRLDRPDKDRAACEVAAELYERGRSILVAAAEPGHAARLDGLLWTWSQESFVPHRVVGQHEFDDRDRVIIADSDVECGPDRVLLLAAPRQFGYMERFDLVVDFAEVHDDQTREESRERFRGWRKIGVKPDFVNHLDEAGSSLTLAGDGEGSGPAEREKTE